MRPHLESTNGIASILEPTRLLAVLITPFMYGMVAVTAALVSRCLGVYCDARAVLAARRVGQRAARAPHILFEPPTPLEAPAASSPPVAPSLALQRNQPESRLPALPDRAEPAARHSQLSSRGYTSARVADLGRT